MRVYQSKYEILNGSSYQELMKKARREYRLIQKRTPRRKAYVRSAYFKKDKVFLDEFWLHLEQKNVADKARRISYYLCAVDLLRHATAIESSIMERGIRLYRFAGITPRGNLFYVQVSEQRKSGRKDFMSVFPD